MPFERVIKVSSDSEEVPAPFCRCRALILTLRYFWDCALYLKSFWEGKSPAVPALLVFTRLLKL